ncbi:hypothetical protein HYFRA_00013643 [Hymenoscyphus fraxineus]|uniref:Uncharacterized protein n=1 Tax=Hymenoscyphus fraxineus TaxID=746836 RepID=A0A9N9Q0R3_9HELO|nr:hypothetical protein HYFRA_00013643 [Hymenoscyphus fraxineus]
MHRDVCFCFWVVSARQRRHPSFCSEGQHRSNGRFFALLCFALAEPPSEAAAAAEAAMLWVPHRMHRSMQSAAKEAKERRGEERSNGLGWAGAFGGLGPSEGWDGYPALRRPQPSPGSAKESIAKKYGHGTEIMFASYHT